MDWNARVELFERVTRRPRYACRGCDEPLVIAPAPDRPVEGGMPTEALIAHVLVSNYADALPLYRQAQMLARQGCGAGPLDARELGRARVLVAGAAP